MFSYILFDLDGTISDPKQGICGSVQYALKSFGIDEPNLDKLEPFIGPPLRDSFMKYYGFTPEMAEEAVAKYREKFAVTGKFENVLYPGMKELLSDLKRAGAHLAIASSKPTVYVEDILQYFGIRSCFEIVVGSELDGTRDTKEEVLEEALRQFRLLGNIGPSQMVMVGDRKFDIEGAKAMGTHSIGVTYGYAPEGELQAAGAEIIVQSVDGLRQVLLGKTEGVFSSPNQNHAAAGRPAPADTKAMQAMKAIGTSLLAVGTFFLVNLVVAEIVMLIPAIVSQAMTGTYSQDAYNYWLNIGNAAGSIAAIAACYGIWHKKIQMRPTGRINGLSVIPAVILAISSALAFNGLLTLLEVYKYSPMFQRISEMQFDTPVWLGILSFGILAPLGEEIVYRGVVYGQLKKISNVPTAAVLSGLIFGLTHGNLVQFIYATVLGILMAIVYEIYDSLLASILFHSIANLFVYIVLDLSPVGGAFLMPASCAFFMLMTGISAVMMVKLQKGKE